MYSMNGTTSQTEVQLTQVKIDAEARAKLIKLADDDKRSMTSEVAWLIEQEHDRRWPAETNAA